jgi:hypothetical protein
MLDGRGYQDDQGYYITFPALERRWCADGFLKSDAVVGGIPCDICFGNAFIGNSPLRADDYLTGIILAR